MKRFGGYAGYESAQAWFLPVFSCSGRSLSFRIDMGRMACDGALGLIRQMLPVMAGGVYRLPCADQAIGAVDADMVLVAKTGTAISMRFAPFSAALALVNLTVQRASRSCWRNISKSTIAFRRSRSLPLADRSFRCSSISKSPGLIDKQNTASEMARIGLNNSSAKSLVSVNQIGRAH